MWNCLAIKAILLALLVLTMSASAQAQTFAGQRPTTSPTVGVAVQIGEDFWHERGVNPCPDPIVYEADDLSNSDVSMAFERADMPGCRIWILSWIVQAGSETRLGTINLCGIIAHALGHTAGLGHSATGVMSAGWDLSHPTNAPWACVEWAKALERVREGFAPRKGR